MGSRSKGKTTKKLKKLSRDSSNRRTETTVQAVVQKYHHSGPLPMPEQLAQYEAYCPGAADRIIRMAENQAAHRQEIEKIVVRQQARNSMVGLLFGFLIGMTAILSGAWVASAGYSWEGFATSFAGLGSLVGVFVYGKKVNQDELKEKKELMRERDGD